MIEKTTAYKVGDKFFPVIEEAQQAELEVFFPPQDSATGYSAEKIAEVIMINSERIIDILTMTPASKPKARAINGGRKPRKAKTVAEPAPEQPA